MSCGTGEYGCGCEEFVHIQLKPKSEKEAKIPPREPFAPEVALAESLVGARESES